MRFSCEPEALRCNARSFFSNIERKLPGISEKMHYVTSHTEFHIHLTRKMQNELGKFEGG